MELTLPPDPPVPAGPRRTRRTRMAAMGLLAGLIGGAVVFGIDHSAISGLASGSTFSSGPGTRAPTAITRPATGGSSGGYPGGSLGTYPGGASSSSAAGSGAPANPTAIAASVAPGLVDINTTFGDQGASGAGTGIVLTSNGAVITNNHVINGATTISVTDIGNGHTYNATVIGYDSTADIAVLQLVGATGLKTATIGDSATATVGEPIVAIGNAGGTGGTPSAAGGSITALNQSVTASNELNGTDERLTRAIGVNADVQPGDSGGPLANTAGQVVGIDTAGSLASSSYVSGASTGAHAFAIPINVAMSIAQRIESGQGTTTIHVGGTGFLGVLIASTASQGGGADIGGAGGSSSSYGLPVSGVVNGGAAARAGLAGGDVITSFNGQRVGGPSTLTALLVPLHPGDTAQIGWTDASGQAHTATVDLGSGPPA